MKKENYAFDYGFNSLLYSNQTYNNHLMNLRDIYKGTSWTKGSVRQMQSFTPNQMEKIQARKRVALELHLQSIIGRRYLKRKKASD